MVAEGGEGENPGCVSLQVPTSEAAVSADTHAFARLPPGGAATITPNSLTLGGVGWFPKAELYSCMKGGVPVFAPAFQPLGRVSSFWGPGQQAPEPCIPAA